MQGWHNLQVFAAADQHSYEGEQAGTKILPVYSRTHNGEPMIPYKKICLTCAKDMLSRASKHIMTLARQNPIKSGAALVRTVLISDRVNEEEKSIGKTCGCLIDVDQVDSVYIVPESCPFKTEQAVLQ